MIKIEVLADVEKALGGIEKLQKETTDKLDKLAKSSQSSFSKLGSTIVVFNQGLELAGKAYRALAGVFQTGISSAIQQEEAINDLNNALKINGKYSESASQDMQNFTSDLQAMTTIGDETALKVAALGASLGKMSGQQLKDATLGAANLSAALGIDLESAMRAIAKSSIDGGTALKRYGIEVKKGSTDSETLANAIAKVNSQFAGSAASKINTFSGALQQTKNSFDDMLEEVGMLIIKNPILVKIFNELSKVFNVIGGLIKSTRDEFIEFSKKAIIKTVDAIGFLLSVVDILGRSLLNVKTIISQLTNFFISSFARIADVSLKAVKFIGGLFGRELKSGVEDFRKEMDSLATDSFGKVIDGFEDIKDQSTTELFIQMKENVAKLSYELEKTPTKLKAVKTAQVEVAASNDEMTEEQIKNAKKVQEEIEKQRQAYIKLGLDITTAISGATKSTADIKEGLVNSLSELDKDLNDQLSEIQAELDAKLTVLVDPDEITKANAEAEAARAKLMIQSENKRQELIQKAEEDRLKASKEAAFNIIKGGAALAADAYLPGSGQFVGPVVDMLMAGGDAIKQTFAEIFKQIPQIIFALVDAIPYVVEAFNENLPKLAVNLSNKLSDPSFWTRFIGNMISALTRSLATVPQTLINGIKDRFSNLGSFFEKIFDVGKIVVDSIWQALKDAGNFLAKIFKFEGGGKGAVENFLGFDFPWMAFAKGGVVPGGAKVTGDSKLNDIIPALLSPGEVVLPRSIVEGGAGGIISFLGSLGIQAEGMAFGGIGKKGLLGKVGGAIGGAFNDVASFVGGVAGDAINNVVGIADILIPGDLQGIYKSLKQFVSDIDIPNFVAHPVSETERLVKGVINLFQPSFKKMLSFGMAEGGMIRSVNGGIAGMDSVPVRLMPGELVVDRVTTGQLKEYLNTPKQEDNSVTNALLAQIVTLLSKDQNIETEVKVDREVFANIILNLTRSNQRLTA